MKILIRAALVLLFAQTALAKEFIAESNKGQVLFKAQALGLKFEGKGAGVSGLVKTIDGVSGKLEFDLSTLDTGIPLRNTHMKENYLEVDKYPKSVFVITKVANFDPNANEQESPFEGQLTVRGIDKPVQNGKVKITKAEFGYKIVASFDTKISAFEIPIPKYAGVVLKDDVKVEASLDLTAKAK